MFLQRFGLLCVIGVAFALVLIAGPRMMAGLELAEAQDVVRQIRSGETSTFQGLRQAIATRRAASNWDPGPRAQAELGEMLLTLAALDQPQAVEMRAELAGEALTMTRAAILKSPTQPFAWTRYTQALALVTETERGTEPAIAPPADPAADAGAAELDPVDRPLAMAIVTGPWQPSLVPSRVEIGLYFWPRLSDFTRRLVAGQIFIAARQVPERLAEVTRRQNALTEVMAILLPDNDLLTEFTRIYFYTQSIEAERRNDGASSQ